MPRSSLNDDQREVLLHQRLERVQRQIRKLNSGKKKRARREDTRRKIIAGALALEHFEKNPGSEFGKIMFRLLDEYARPDDRRLFEFLPVRDVPANQDVSDQTQAAE
jgi:hypothetical protein